MSEQKEGQQPPVPQEVKTPEEREVGARMPVLLVYRDNVAFQEFVPTLQQVITEDGRVVELQVFPQGTEEKDIGKWAEENKSLFQNRLVLTDTTFQTSIQRLGVEGISHTQIRVKVGGYLDDLSSKVTEQAVNALGVDPRATVDYGLEDLTESQRVDKLGETITQIIKIILRDPKNRPEKIIIDPYKLAMHEPFTYLMTEQERSTYNKNRFTDAPETMARIKAKLQEFLVNAGIPKDIIEFRDRIGSPDLDQQGNWIIADRHNTPERIPSKAKYLELPAGNLLAGAESNGMVKLTGDEIQKATRSIGSAVLFDIQDQELFMRDIKEKGYSVAREEQIQRRNSRKL